jgi:hypothetical protein
MVDIAAIQRGSGSVPDWRAARSATQEWLSSMGRDRAERGPQIHGVCLDELPEEKILRCGETFGISGRVAAQLVRGAYISYARDALPDVDEGQTPLLPQLDSTAFSGFDRMRMHFVSVTGPVYITRDPETGVSLAPTPRPVLVVSLPPLDLAGSPVERAVFTRKGPRRRRDGSIIAPELEMPRAGERARSIIQHALLNWHYDGIQVPVLGMPGAEWHGKYSDPAVVLWGHTVAAVLSAPDEEFHFTGVCVVVRSAAEFGVYKQALEQRSAELHMPVVLLAGREAVSVCHFLASRGMAVGLWNPCSAQAVAQGMAGGPHWDAARRGHGREALLALHSTLLLQHRGVSPDLYEDAWAYVPVTLDLEQE